MQTITITGYLSRDAEKRRTQGGQDVTALNIPVKQGWGDKEQTNWFRCSVWGKRADFAGNLRKGEFVCVTGELSIGEYNGKPQYEINVNDFHSVRTAPRDNAPADNQGGGGHGYQDQQPDDLEDEIPFITSGGNF